MINIQKIIFMVRNIVKNIVEKATKILVVNAGRISTTELVDKIYNFCEVYSGKVMYAYQAQFSKRIIRSVLENDGVELTALFSRQSGKCFAKDTEILMYDGRREKVQDIREGDLVMTPNSSFAKVVSLGRGTEEMYEVKPLEKNHESFVVNKSHILSLMGENNEVKNISVEDYLKLPEWERKKYRGYRVGVEYKHKSVPLDPYLLGINIGLVNIKPDEERRIPKCYLINNRRKRLKLLAGLIDSNVCVECNEDSNILTFNNKELAKDVLVLIRSLGYKSNIAEKIVEDNKVIYNVKSYGDFSYILNAEDIESKEGGIVKFDFELIPKGVGEYYGFTLDSKDRLFLLGDYTVTHNTETVAITVGGLMIILPQLANMPMFLEDPRFRMFRDGFQVGIFAPSQRQAQITYGRMKSRLQCKEALVVLEDPDFNLVFTTSNGQTVALSNGSFCTAISASDGSSIEGESFKFIICEECQDISNYKIRKSIHPMGAAYNATICKIGTATTFKGDFYEAINRNKEDFKKKKTGIRNHFEYDYKVVQRYNPKYAKYIEREKRSLGETSDEFQMSYCLKWVISRGMFVDINKFEAECGDNYLDRVYQDHTATHVVGIDIGGGSSKNRKEADSTIITVVEVDWENPVLMESTIDEETGEPIVYMAYNTYIKDWYEIAPEIAENYEEQYHLIMDYLKNFKVARLVIDATREASLGQRIMANVNYDVVLFTFSSKSKSDIYKHLQTEINTGRARFPNNPKTRETKEYKKYLAQMGDLQKSYSGSYLVVSHPDSRTAHDDYPDSWALAVWGTKDVGQVDNTETQNRDSVLRSHRETSMLFRSRNHYTARRR